MPAATTKAWSSFQNRARCRIHAGGFLGLLLIVSISACGIGFGKETSTSTPKKNPAPKKAPAKQFLIIDYLPPALYEKEPLTSCFRLENASSKSVTFTVTATFWSTAKRPVHTHKKKLTVKKNKFGLYQHDHELAGIQKIRFEVQTASGKLKNTVVQILRDSATWPETEVLNSRLVRKSDGAFLLPIVKRRKQDEERTWAPLKWMLKGSDKASKKVSPAKILVCLPGSWADPIPSSQQSEKLQFTQLLPASWKKYTSPQSTLALGPYFLNGSAPILSAIGNGLHVSPDKNIPFKRAIILLPPEDLDVSTDPRVYRIVLEAWIVRLHARNIEQIILIPPFRYGVPLKRQKLLWASVKQAARTQKAKYLSISALLEESLWRVAPETKGVYGKMPNEKGRIAIGEALAPWLK